jgi:O-antigen ligase
MVCIGDRSLLRLHALNLCLQKSELLPNLHHLGGCLHYLLACSVGGGNSVSLLLHGFVVGLGAVVALAQGEARHLLNLRRRLLVLSLSVAIILYWCGVSVVGIAPGPCVFGGGCWPPRWSLPFSCHYGFVSAKPRWASMLETVPSGG